MVKSLSHTNSVTLGEDYVPYSIRVETEIGQLRSQQYLYDGAPSKDIGHQGLGEPPWLAKLIVYGHISMPGK